MKLLLVALCLCLAATSILASPPYVPEDQLSDNCKTPKCPADATSKNGKPVTLPYPLDCLQYVICEGSVARVVPCPPDLFYNENTGHCDTKENAACVPCYQRAPKK